MSVIEAEFGLFQMKIKGVFRYPAESGESSFGETPEALDAVDVVELLGEDVLPVLDPEVLVEAQIDQAVIACPAIECGARS